MLFTRVQRIIEKNIHEIVGVLFRKYPTFILNDHEGAFRELPAFVFHDVTSESLEPMLCFLAENGYGTFTADEYVERQARGERGQEREVLLTFDDGLKGLYTAAYPALKRYGLKAVAYVVPGVTPEGDGAYGTEEWDKSLCNWKEIREMHDSGTLDIQSHSMYHHSIPVSSRVLDFVQSAITFPLFEPYQATPIGAEPRKARISEFAYGTAICKGSPRYGNARAFQETPSVVLACVDYVRLHGGADYFRTPRWRSRLKAVMEEARQRDGNASVETEAEQRAAILRDLIDSKREIERRLPGKTVRHFAYPWFRGSALAARLSAEAGYVSNAWASLVPRFVVPGELPIPITRFLPSYLWRLPGKGRRTLSEVLRERFAQLHAAKFFYE